MTLILKMDCDNAAFEDAPEMEIARILREAARVIEQERTQPNWFLMLRDVNGNTVGRVKVTN